MGFQDNVDHILWRLHLKSPPTVAYSMISTNEGRSQFWAETAIEEDGQIHFIFPNGFEWKGKIHKNVSPREFSLEYIDGSITTFTLQDDGKGGTDLVLTDEGVAKKHRTEVIAGWVSVLMNLKAAVDFSIDLRNHDQQRTWDQQYVEN
ncbi:MAG: SRPBCC domain-containing protein [Candidatus Hodarchaeota archaeon]